MLDLFRSRGLTSVVYGVIIVGMVAVFIIGFNPSAGKKLGSVNEACAARVRGSCIEPKAQRAAYRLIFARGTGQMKQQAAGRVVLDGLIERELLVEDAERLGLTVTDEEITDSIFHSYIRVSVPSDNLALSRSLGIDDGKVIGQFKDPKTKQFDMKVYEKQLKVMTGRSPHEFREWQRRELLAAKVRDLVRAPVRIAEEEALDRYTTERTNATVSYAVVRRSWLEKYGMSSDAKDIDAWAKDKTNLSQVKSPVSHILVMAQKPEEKVAKKGKAQEILDRVKKGEDFAKLAKEFSEDPGSKDKGGQYGGEMVSGFVEPFRKAYESAKPGEVVPELVETNFGWHIIRRDEATKDQIEKAYKSARSIDLAKEVSTKIADDMRSGISGDDAIKAAISQFAKYTPAAPKPAKASADAGAGDAGAADAAPAAPVVTADTDPERPQMITSSPFNRGGSPIPAINEDASEAVVKFAFGSKSNDVADPIRTDDGFIVLQLKDIKPATKADFEKERDVYMEGLLIAKQAEALSHYVKRLRESAKADIKIDEANAFGKPTGDAGAAPDDEGDEGP